MRRKDSANKSNLRNFLENAEPISMRSYSRRISNGATNGALRQLDSIIQQNNQIKFRLEENRNSNARIANNISVLENTVKDVTEQSNKTLGMLGEFMQKFNEYKKETDKTIDALKQKIESKNDGGGILGALAGIAGLGSLKDLLNVGKNVAGANISSIKDKVLGSLGSVGKTVLARAPLIGGIMQGVTDFMQGEDLGKSLATGAGTILGGLIGGAVGLVGGPAGSMIGGVAGSLAGGTLAKQGFETIFGTKLNESAAVKRSREEQEKLGETVPDNNQSFIDKILKSAGTNKTINVENRTQTENTTSSSSEVSGSLIDTIKNFEGFEAKAKWDYNQYTNGYGTKALSPDEVITRDEAERRLNQKVAELKAYVEEYGRKHKYDWNTNQVNSLTSFAYNLGPGAIDQVTAGGTRSNVEISSMMLEYNKAGGKIHAGLVDRRIKEAHIFNRDVKSQPDAIPTEKGAISPGQSISPGPSTNPPQDYSEGYKPTPGEPLTKKPENVVFASNSRIDISSIDKDLLSKFYAAAQEYGKPVTIDSAVRSDEYQAELWARGSLGEPGIYTPALPMKAQTVTIKNGPFAGRNVNVPGGGRGSSHRDGNAIDSGTAAKDPLFVSILQKHGLHVPFGSKDPVHIEKIGSKPAVHEETPPSKNAGPVSRPTSYPPPPIMIDRTSRAQVPGPLGFVANAPDQGPMAGILSQLAINGTRALVQQSQLDIMGLVGTVLNTALNSNRNTRVPNPSFAPDPYADNNVPPAMPPSNTLKEIFGKNISNGYYP